MSSAVSYQGGSEVTDIPMVAKTSIILGLIEAVFVAVFSLAMRFTSGVAEFAVCGAIVAAGAFTVAILPGLWTRARGIDGIATAAGIGLGAAMAYMVPDIAILRPLGMFTNRWDQIGGFSNWWHHPVWWMLGSFLPWMGATVLAAQTKKSGQPSPVGLVVQVLAFTVVLMAAAVLLHFPGAAWSLPTFGVAMIPAFGLAGLLGVIQLNRN